MEKYTTYIMVPEDKNINATVVNTYTNSSQSAGNTRTHREMSEDEIKKNIINSIPSCTILNNDSHQKSPVTSCEGQPTQLNIGLESEDSQSKDDIEISENSESDSSGIEEDNNKDFSNTMEDSQSKEYNEKNGQESNCDSDFVTFTDETTSNDALNISKDVFEMTRGSDFDESFLCTNGCMERFGYCNIHSIRGRPDGCEEKQRKARDVIQEDTVGSGTNVRLADRLYKTCVKRDQSYDTQKKDVGFAINTINEIILDGSSHREDPDGCEEDTRDDSMDVKKQDCSMILEMQFISRKPFHMQIFLWRIDAITLVWIIVKIGIVITATILSISIAKLGIVVTATIVSIVKLEMVVMKLVNESDICTYASQQGQLVSVSEIENPIHTKVNTAIISIESEDYIEYKMEDGEMQEKKVGFAIVDIDNKEVPVEVKKEKDNIESEPASDNGQENEKGIISGQLVFEGQCIEDGNDGGRVIGQMQRMVGDMVGEKVWLKKSLEENESIDEKANGDILETENNLDDIEAVNHFRKDTNELVCQRVEAIQGKADDFHGEREAAKAREEQIEIDSEKTDKEVDINAKASVKEIQVCEIPNKNVVIGDNKAADEMIGNDDQSGNNRATREPIGKCKRQQNDFDGEKVGSEIEEEKDQTSGKKAVGEILNANDGGDGEKAACSNSDKDATCGDIGGSSDIIKTQGEEKKENFIPRGQTENIDDRKAVGIKIEDIYHTKTVNETGVEDYLKDNTVFDEQDDKEGTNSHQVERSGSTTGHSIRDLNHFQRIIIVLLICGIPCARGASSELSTKVRWSLQTNPVVFGSNATLCCIMQYPDTDHMAWIRDSGAMIVATGDSPSNRSKYSASMELRGNLTYYFLTIINVDMTDVNVNYKCESDFDLFEQKLELNEDNFVMEPSSKETVTNITRENGMITVSLRMRNMYPKPKCFFSSKKEKINGNVSLEENGKLYNVKMACGIREDMCEYIVTAYCALGKKMVSIDLPTSNNSWTQRCSKDRHGNDSVVIVTVVIIITLLCIVTLVKTGLFVKKYFSRKVSYAFQLVLKSEQPVREDV